MLHMVARVIWGPLKTPDMHDDSMPPMVMMHTLAHTWSARHRTSVKCTILVIPWHWPWLFWASVADARDQLVREETGPRRNLTEAQRSRH